MKMRTLVASEQNSIKKKFQKPNILRKKSKPQLRPNVIEVKEPLRFLSQNDNVTSCLDRESEVRSELSCQVTYTPENLQNLLIKDVPRTEQSQTYLLEIDGANIVCMSDTNVQYKNVEHDTINIDSFLNGTDVQNATLTVNSVPVKDEMCLDLLSSNKGLVLNTLNDGSQFVQVKSENTELLETNKTTSVMDEQKIQLEENRICQTKVQSAELLTSQAIKYKCDVQNCNKGFWSAAKLDQHKNTHNKQSRWSSNINVECPVKKIKEDGMERCGKMFNSRENLLKHLNEDHKPEDAPYRCEVCDRRFFWAVGLRAHSQSRCGRSALVCCWPGCDREFRQPCRLREHLRAHTGDRPYHCTHPNCGLSFRSASKLERHVRGHTGERKHACDKCGRAFLRRDHLREHAQRCHPQPLLCTHDSCKEVFTDASALCLHLKEVHGQDAVIARTQPTKRTAVSRSRQNAFVISLIPEQEIKQSMTLETASNLETGVAESDMKLEAAEIASEGEIAAEVETAIEVEAAAEVETAEEAEAEEWRAARTHCTWPLPRHAAYVLEEDTRTEQSENSESNIYTVRSDLFLHGNVLINEDSEFIVSRELSSRSTEEVATGMDLSDAHPTIDLLQEELMYADAVDESSFRVFLMNGEDLS